jgi:hypothetical protein
MIIVNMFVKFITNLFAIFLYTEGVKKICFTWNKRIRFVQTFGKRSFSKKLVDQGIKGLQADRTSKRRAWCPQQHIIYVDG